MDAYTCIRTKRDTRLYQDRPIPKQSLRRILQAGRMAGSAKNLQPCRFVVLQDTPKKGVPQGYRVSIVLAFGYPPPSGPRPKGTPRIPLEELVHWGGW